MRIVLLAHVLKRKKKGSACVVKLHVCVSVSDMMHGAGLREDVRGHACWSTLNPCNLSLFALQLQRNFYMQDLLRVFRPRTLQRLIMVLVLC